MIMPHDNREKRYEIKKVKKLLVIGQILDWFKSLAEIQIKNPYPQAILV